MYIYVYSTLLPGLLGLCRHNGNLKLSLAGTLGQDRRSWAPWRNQSRNSWTFRMWLPRVPWMSLGGCDVPMVLCFVKHVTQSRLHCTNYIIYDLYIYILRVYIYSVYIHIYTYSLYTYIVYIYRECVYTYDNIYIVYIYSVYIYRYIVFIYNI